MVEHKDFDSWVASLPDPGETRKRVEAAGERRVHEEVGALVADAVKAIEEAEGHELFRASIEVPTKYAVLISLVIKRRGYDAVIPALQIGPAYENDAVTLTVDWSKAALPPEEAECEAQPAGYIPCGALVDSCGGPHCFSLPCKLALNHKGICRT